MEASALELRRETARATGLLNGPLLRLRSDEQLVELFRAGNEDAFRAIHDRYRKRLFAYAAQMLNGSGPDAEDALQDVFERAYFGLRSHDRAMALRAWLYRVAHNRCLDQLRRPTLAGTTQADEAESRMLDPVAATEQRETLRRLVVDIDRLPEQQRSALLLREMSGMSYAELAGALGVSVPAVKSLLVRARIGLAAAGQARDTACSMIREELVLAQDRGVRPNANARRHLRDCPQCRHFRRSMRSVGRNLAVLTPAIGPLGFLVKLVGGGGGLTGSGGGAAAGGSAAAGGGSFLAATGAAGSTGLVTGGFAAGGAGHVAAIVAAALVTAGGAVAARPDAGRPVRVHPVISRPAPVSAPPRPAGPAGAGPTASYGVAALSGSIPAQPASASATGRPAAARGPETKSRHPVAAGPSVTSIPAAPAGSATGSSSAVTDSSPASGSASTATTSSAGSTSAATSIPGAPTGDSGTPSDSSAGPSSSATSSGTSASSSSTAPPSGS